MFYGIYYASFYTQYLQLLAAYSLAQPTSEEVLAGQSSSFQGALAAAGRLEVPQANTATSALVEPLCSGAICQQSIYALAPDTAFQVCCVRVLFVLHSLAAWCCCCSNEYMMRPKELVCTAESADPGCHVYICRCGWWRWMWLAMHRPAPT